MVATNTYWSPNSPLIAQVITGTCTAPGSAGDTAVATMGVAPNTVAITYTVQAGDTTTTVITNLLALLNATGNPAQFGEVKWTSLANVLTATAQTPGTPFTLTLTTTGGCAITQATAQANVSPSDVGNAANWLRGGVRSLPTNADPVIANNSNVPMLWNLSALSAVQFASYQRWQSMTGQIGLPSINPLGYIEYRPTYFQFSGSGTLLLNLGLGSTGTGPTTCERYNTGSVHTNLVAQGGAATINFLGTSTSNTFAIEGCTVAIANYTAEVANLATGTVDSGGTLTLGPGVTISGTVQTNAGTLTTYVGCSILALNGSTITVASQEATHATVTGTLGSTITWLSDSTITTLLLQTNSTLDKSQDARGMTITNATIDGDTCRVLDPNLTITWSNAVTVKNQVNQGPFTWVGTRTVWPV